MLADLQALLYRLITAPGGVDEALADKQATGGVALDRIIAGDDRLSARERVEIYANAYFYRLLGVFKEDFPRTSAILGDTNFHNLITGYLLEYPPSAPSLLEAGRYLARYLSLHPLLGEFPFVADLARLERASLEVFHGPDAAPLDDAVLRELPPEKWPSLNLRLHPAAQIVDVEWRVDKLMDLHTPQSVVGSAERTAASILIWRREWHVYRRELPPGERAALKAAARGADFAAICMEIARELSLTNPPLPSEEVPAAVNRMLAGWLSDGVLCADGPEL